MRSKATDVPAAIAACPSVTEVTRFGFDGALGTICEVREGRYTGRALRALHAEAKAECVRALAESEGFDLSASTAYSDSHTDLPFLEAVGRPLWSQIAGDSAPGR